MDRSYPMGGKALLAGFSALLFSLPLLLLGYEDGPPPATTGGFGEATCLECHFGRPLNAPGHTLQLEGLPEQYQAGKRYELTLHFEPEAEWAGFELSVRFAGGEKKGMQAGELRPVKGPLEVIRSASSQRPDPEGATASKSSGPEIQYARHTGVGVGRWTVEWTAPQRAEGPVVFHAAANASNGDSSALGDFVYTLATEVGPEE